MGSANMTFAATVNTHLQARRSSGLHMLKGLSNSSFSKESSYLNIKNSLPMCLTLIEVKSVNANLPMFPIGMHKVQQPTDNHQLNEPLEGRLQHYTC